MEPDSACCQTWLCGLNLKKGGGLSDLLSQACLSARRYRPHELVFREGQAPDAVYYVSQGSLRIFKTGLRGRQQIYCIAGPGDLVGLHAFFMEHPHRVLAEAREAARLCAFSLPVFHNLLRQQPELSRLLIRQLLDELCGLRDELLARLNEEAPERVLAAIRRYGPAAGGPAFAPLRKVELADLVGIVPETVSRILRKLERDRLIETRGRLIRLRPNGDNRGRSRRRLPAPPHAAPPVSAVTTPA